MIAKLEPKDFVRLRDFAFEHLGIQLVDAKITMVEQRLRSLVDAEGCKSFDDFTDRLVKNPSGPLMTEFVNRITTNHTYFNREPEHFDFLVSRAMPEAVARIRRETKSGSTPTFRLWCAAASRGHEPYTLAMLERKFFGSDYGKWDAGLLATDISEKALKLAVAGVYDADEVDDLPSDLRDHYLKKRPSGDYEVTAELRRDVTYRRLNLNAPSYNFRRPFDVIFCRNVLIYFDMPTKRDVVSKLARVLTTDGYLFVGLAESLGRDVEPFKYISPGIYKKVA